MKKNTFSPLSLTLLVLFAAITPLMLMAIWFGTLLYQQQLDGALSRQQQSSTLLKMRIEADLERFKAQVDGAVLPLQKLLIRPDLPGAQQQIEELLRLMVTSEPALAQVIVVPVEGGVLIGTGSEQANKSLASELQGSAPPASLPLVTVVPQQQGKALLLSFGIGSPVLALFAAKLDAKGLWLGKESLLTEVGGHMGYYFVLDANARLMAGLAGGDYQIGDVVGHLTTGTALLADKQWPAQQTYLNGEGVRVYASRTEIPALSWTLISEVNAASILQPIKQLLLMLALFASAAVIIIVVFILRLMRRFLLPVDKARAAIDQVSEGDYQLDLKPVGIPEIDAMTVSIQRMSAARQIAENALQESRQDLLVTLNSIGDGVIACDDKGLITRMNRAAEELTAWSIDAAWGQPVSTVFNIVDTSTRESIASPVEKVLGRGKTVYSNTHTTLLAKRGREYQIAHSAAPICGDDDRVIGMVLVFNDVTEAYQLREKAVAAQQELEGLFADMQTMVCVTEPDSTVIFANKAPMVASGVGLEDIQGRKFWDCVWFEGNAILQQQIRNNCTDVRAGESVQQDIQIKVLGGLLWVDYSMHPMFDEHGEVVRILHEGRDISGRKMMEEEARSAAQHLSLYRDQTPLAAIEWDTDVHVVNLNAAAETMFGYSLEEIIGQDLTNTLFTSEQLKQARTLINGSQLQTGVLRSRTETRTKDGRNIMCEWHTTLLRNTRDEPIGAASVVLDITAQQEATQALELKEQEQRESLNCMVDGVISIDERGQVLSVNQSAENMFGYGSEELVGRNVSRLMPAADAEQHDTYIARYLRTGEAHVIGLGREVEGLRKNTETFPMRLQIAELPHDAEGLRRFIGTCHDLSKSRQQEEQLRRSHKMDALGKLTGGVAHDFNNILGVVTGYADLLESMLVDHPRWAKYASEINHAGQRGAKLTKKLLSFSRQGVPAKTRLDINQLLLGQQELLQKTLTVSIDLVLELAPEIWPILLDGSDLEDAVLNMSINALHAMEGQARDARLTISTSNQSLNTIDAATLGLSETGDYVELRLADTGTGMDEETREQIFDPFFSTKGEKGTGLGLSQVFGFVSHAGGVIKVYSERGYGSEFVLYFPRYREDEVAEVLEPTRAAELPGGRETILVVDDEVALRELAAELLSQKGYQVSRAEDAHQALEILQSTKIDLILSDLIMPGMNGYQLAAEVRKDYPATKILLASGFADQRNVDKIDRQLHAQMLHKPYNSRVLYKAVRDLLDAESKSIS